MHEAARSLRTAERYLIAPPLGATFGVSPVSICDISIQGARFRHETKLETGAKAVLKVIMHGVPQPIALEALIIWSQPDASGHGVYISGARMYGTTDVISSLLTSLLVSKRSQRIEELRATDRFFIVPAVEGLFGRVPLRIDDLSARGARVGTDEHLAPGLIEKLSFRVPASDLHVVAGTRVIWSKLKSVSGEAKRYHAGMAIDEKPEQLRLAIGQLSQINRALLDTKSLALKLKILRARARQLAPSYRAIEASGIPAEQYLLIQGVREELRLNPEEAFHWYRRARIIIQDPATRTAAPPIADHPDALAVWEYLDRSVDPSIVGRAFDLGEG
jgi:hypothetical protein